MNAPCDRKGCPGEGAYLREVYPPEAPLGVRLHLCKAHLAEASDAGLLSPPKLAPVRTASQPAQVQAAKASPAPTLSIVSPAKEPAPMSTANAAQPASQADPQPLHCRMPDCTAAVKVRGLCKRHYDSALVSGTLSKVALPAKNPGPHSRKPRVHRRNMDAEPKTSPSEPMNAAPTEPKAPAKAEDAHGQGELVSNADELPRVVPEAWMVERPEWVSKVATTIEPEHPEERTVGYPPRLVEVEGHTLRMSLPTWDADAQAFVASVVIPAEVLPLLLWGAR